MLKNSIVGIIGILSGLLIGYFIVQQIPLLNSKETANTITEFSKSIGLKKNNVIGFLPYWLLEFAKEDYSPYITTLTYFGLTLEPDGTIRKFTNPGESEPGLYALDSGRADNFLTAAKEKNINLSLLVFSADEDDIAALIENPEEHAINMMEEVTPIMKEYGFTDLNIDIESVRDASPEARLQFTRFVKQVNTIVDKENLGTITVDVSPTAMLRNYLINVDEVSKIVDYVVFMTYDYHYSGSYVTGAVSPVGGMGIDAEFDSETAIKLAKQIMPEHKIILGIPLYGYRWETLDKSHRAAIIPGSGAVISSRKVEKLLDECSNCEVKIDEPAKEYYVVYEDEETGTYHQIFYPEEKATAAKVKLAETYHIGGIAAWALGYEGDTILDPLKEYK